MKDDEQAQRARAKQLREQIEELTTPEPKGKTESGAKTGHEHETPRNFIQRRMRELDKKDKPTPE